jgi:isocitrate dehydrogenase (NAD+)
MSHHTVTLIAGDGIGDEVTKACVRAIAATSVRIDWDIQSAGLEAVHNFGVALPKATLDSIKKKWRCLKRPDHHSGWHRTQKRECAHAASS